MGDLVDMTKMVSRKSFGKDLIPPGHESEGAAAPLNISIVHILRGDRKNLLNVEGRLKGVVGIFEKEQQEIVFLTSIETAFFMEVLPKLKEIGFSEVLTSILFISAISGYQRVIFSENGCALDLPEFPA